MHLFYLVLLFLIIFYSLNDNENIFKHLLYLIFTHALHWFESSFKCCGALASPKGHLKNKSKQVLLLGLIVPWGQPA